MMNNSLKGALLSCLAFPDLGQVVLKHYKRGAALMLAFTVTLLAILIAHHIDCSNDLKRYVKSLSGEINRSSACLRNHAYI